MANVVEDVETLESAGYLILALLVIGVVGFVGYEIYQTGSSVGDAIAKLQDSVKTALPTWLGGTPTSAETGNLQTGTGPGFPEGVVPTEGGYDKQGAKNLWSCTGGANDMCTPYTVNSAGHTITLGSPVPASQAN